MPAIVGVMAVYVVALPYAALIAIVYMAKPIAFATLINGFFLAFLPLDIVKAAGAALVASQIQRVLR